MTALQAQGYIRLPQHQADTLFGKLGTHSKCAGATLWLRDIIHNDRFGRQVTVLAEGRRVAASAINTALFQLCHEFCRKLGMKDSQWYYIKGEKQGPHPYAKMVKWARRGWFPTEDMPVQHADLKCWVPLWFLLHMDDMQHGGNAAAGGDPQEVQSMDLDEVVNDIRQERLSGLLTGSLALGAGGGLEEFPELLLPPSYQDAAEPMDYEASPSSLAGIQGGARLFVVVDTNVLMSHMASTERMFDDLSAAASLDAAAAGANGNTINGSSTPLVEALLVVPWIVLNELDKLKHSKKREQADSARYALSRLRQLTSARDTFVRAQTAAEHAKAVEEMPSPLAGNARELRNDDFILQTCQYYSTHLAERLCGVGLHSSVVLLSNDQGLSVRAQVNGIKCYLSQEFPRDPQVLAKECVDWEQQHSSQLGDASPTSLTTPQGAKRGPMPGTPDGRPSPSLSVGDPPGYLYSPHDSPLVMARPGMHLEVQQAQQAAAQQVRKEGAWAAQQVQQAEAVEHLRRLQIQQSQQAQQAMEDAHTRQLQQAKQAHQAAAEEQLRHLQLQQVQQQMAQQPASHASAGGPQQPSSSSSTHVAQKAQQAPNPALQVAAFLAQSGGLSSVEALYRGLELARSGSEPTPQITQVLEIVNQRPELLRALQQAQREQQQGAAAGAAQEAQQQAAAAAAAVAASNAAAAAQGSQQVADLEQLMHVGGLSPAQMLLLQQALLAQQGAGADSAALEIAAAQQAHQQRLLLAAMHRSASGGLGRQEPGASSAWQGSDASMVGEGSYPASPTMAGYSQAMAAQQAQQQAMLVALAQQAQQQQDGYGNGQGMAAAGMMRVPSEGSGGLPFSSASGGGGQMARSGMPLQAMTMQIMHGSGTGGGGGVHSVSGEVAGAGPSVRESWDELAANVCEAVVTGLAPFVKYHRQQEFGDFWTDMLANDQQLPWDAKTVMHLVEKTEFRDYLSRGTRAGEVRELQRFCYHRCKPRPSRPDPHQVLAAARALQAVVQEFARSAHKPIPNAESPDPDAIGPEFVSLGAASAALQQCSATAQALLSKCTLKLQQQQQIG